MAESQNQWDFGELFSKEEVRRVLSVSELTKKVKRQIEEGVGQIWVEGEITNLRRQSSGHIYFSIKDDKSLCFFMISHCKSLIFLIFSM